LLRLPAPVQVALRDNQISMGHARALINVENEEEQLFILNEAVKKQLSVREVERLVKEASGKLKRKPEKVKTGLPEQFREIKNELANRFETKVDIKRNNKGRGTIVIPFKSDDDLQRIINILDK
jgi:ParB family chromosome partitioning protein